MSLPAKILKSLFLKVFIRDANALSSEDIRLIEIDKPVRDERRKQRPAKLADRKTPHFSLADNLHILIFLILLPLTSYQRS